MGLIQRVWEGIKTMLGIRKDVLEVFDATPEISTKMEELISMFDDITRGEPGWIDADDDIRSISFASFIDKYIADLVCLNMEVKVTGSERAKELQKDIDYMMKNIVDHVAEAIGNVGIMFKPNGENIDYVEPGYFVPLETNSNGDILACAFKTVKYVGKYKYTKWEKHQFVKEKDPETEEEKKVYKITNKAFKSEKNDALGDECPLSEIDEWADIEPETTVENLEKPLYAYFRNPAPNNVDRRSALGLPIWYPAIMELSDLDIAWSRKSDEAADSKHITFVPQNAIKYAEQEKITLPRFVKGLELGMTSGEKIDEHVPSMITANRLMDINSILAMISMKCGLSTSTFKLDEKTGMITATQVEADDQETIRTVKTLRDTLKIAIDDLVYACNKMADIRQDTLPTSYKIDYDWGDITYNYEEDRAMWLSYVTNGYVTPEKYFEKFEGMTPEEAKKTVKEAREAIIAQSQFNVSEMGEDE